MNLPIGFEIRSIRLADIPEVFQLMKSFAAFDGSSTEFNIDQVSLQSAYFNHPKKLEGVVLVKENTVVGFANFFATFSSFELKNTLWVEDVFITPAVRRFGLGSHLFEFLKIKAKEKGCFRLEWLVRRDNEIGVSFYKKLGAQVDEGTIYVKWDVDS